MSGKNQHVVPYGDRWAVRGERNSRVTQTFDTQADAIDYGRQVAMNQEAELKIHRPNGQIRQGWSYGNDPFPPKG